MKLEVSSKREKTKLVVIFAVLGFVTAFLSAPFILNTVFGEVPESYNETLNITKNASEYTEGYMVSSYIDNVKQDICKTLVDAAEYEECLNL